MPNLPTKDQAVTSEYLRSITDEDAKGQLLHPRLWSYIVRDPTGLIFSHGRCPTRKACERLAVAHAGEHAEELLIISVQIPVDGWRFVAWPPSAKRRQRKRSKPWRLSKLQVEVLKLCLEHKLSRYRHGWYCYHKKPELGCPRAYSALTINSLWERGLLDANVIDPRVRSCDLGELQKLEGASKFQVWTSALGRKVLEDKGFCTKHSELLYN